ncbi:cytochrome P450 87A3-like [Tasmannia lanceolata]|uniref:cytochrome P450 87A3-like n=1 Tax=Tasmannia lanceolata TaxID=3420 RepID=UPI004063EA0D
MWHRNLFSGMSDYFSCVCFCLNRYGGLFRTNLLGQPVIVSTDPELCHFILQQERLFQSWYPETIAKIFGRQNLGLLPAPTYKYAKSLVMNIFGMESMKEKLLPQVDNLAYRYLCSWSKKPSIELKEAIASMIFDLTAKKLISYDPTKSTDNLRKNFDAFTAGLVSFPVDIPGTTYHTCLKGRKAAMKTLEKMLQERRASPTRRHGDFFDYVLDELKKEGNLLTEEIALDLIFVLLFASYETTTLTLTLVVKFLTDNPKVLERLTEEHEEILRMREDPDSGITWKEYKSMKFTAQVLNETSRLANVAPGIFRKAFQDFTTKDGYTIPAGWAIMVCPPAVHLNPATYEDPLAFNPWRWEGTDTRGGSNDFLAFGGGMRYCVGADFSKLQMTVFVHHLVTKYRWTAIKGGEILRRPGLGFPNGFHIQLFEK